MPAGDQKQRLDELVVAAGLAADRDRAKRLIMAAEIRVDGQMVDKPGYRFKPQVHIERRPRRPRFASRAGQKLARALESFKLDVEGQVCLDVGAAHGGFTSCLLASGACQVIACDTGYGQLAYELRQDPRVVVLERTNARYLDWQQVRRAGAVGRPQLVTMDVSFISVRTILPAVASCMAVPASGVILVKPQFEAARDVIPPGGVIDDPRVHQRVLDGLVSWCNQHDWQVQALDFSPITGSDGNIEFLLHLELKLEQGVSSRLEEGRIQAVVAAAHRALKGEDND